MIKKEETVIATAKFKLSKSLDFRHIINAAFGAPALICQISEPTRKELCQLFFSGSNPKKLPSRVPDKDYLMIVFKQEYQQQLHEVQQEYFHSEMMEEVEYNSLLQEVDKKAGKSHFQTVSSLMQIIRERNGLVKINQLSSGNPLGIRHLRRIITQYTGSSLKELITMERLKQTFIHIAAGISVERALFLQDFYDFSHFSKTCQKHLSAKPHQLTDSNFFIEIIKSLYLPNNR